MAGDVESRQRVRYIKDHFLTIPCAERAFISGLTVDCTTALTKVAKRMARESLCGQMVRFMMVSSKQMIAMDSAFYTTQTASATKVLGKMVRSTEKVPTYGRMVPNTLFSMRRERKRIKASWKAIMFRSNN